MSKDIDKSLNYIVEENINERIDKYLTHVSQISRVEIQKLISLKQIFVNDNVVLLNKFKIKENDSIKILSRINRDINIIAEDIPLDIIYEDDFLIVINKKTNIVTHPAPGNYTGTLVNALMYHFKNLSNINGKLRPGIVHRLDKETSGLLVVAKDNDTHKYLSKLLETHKIKREYQAIIIGNIVNKITHIDLPIGRNIKNRQMMAVSAINSKKAITHVYINKRLKDHTLIKCILETGRTHQIRVHLSYIKFPILGDNKYGKKIDEFGQYLHAEKLSFVHPNGKKMVFSAKLPKEFLKKIKELSN